MVIQLQGLVIPLGCLLLLIQGIEDVGEIKANVGMWATDEKRFSISLGGFRQTTVGLMHLSQIEPFIP